MSRLAWKTRNSSRTLSRLHIECALVICTTLSVASSPAFQIIRQPVCAIFKESRHATNQDLVDFLSSHCAVNVHLIICDRVYLVPSVPSPQLNNPFQDQCHRSTFSRLHHTRFPVNELESTSRSTNEYLLDLCKKMNGDENIHGLLGSFETGGKNVAKATNSRVRGITHRIVDGNKSTIMGQVGDAIDSSHCYDTAFDTDHDLTERTL